MNTQQNMEERLWNFIDGTSSEEEKNLVRHLVEQDSVWRARYGELMEFNKMLHSTELDAPSLRFTRNVMEEIGKLHIAPASKTYINNRIVWGIGFFFIAMMVSFLVYGFSQMNFSSGEESKISQNLNKVDFSKFFSNEWVNAFMMVNVVIGLVLLDHYLSNKRKAFRKDA